MTRSESGQVHSTRRRVLAAMGAAAAVAGGAAGVTGAETDGIAADARRTAATRSAAATADGQTWPQFRGNPANTGHNPDAGGPQDEAGIGWEFETGFPLIRSVTAGDGTLYAGHDHGLAAIDPADGSTEWEQATSDLVDHPAVADSCIAVQGGPAGVLGLDKDSGEQLWEFEPESIRGPHGQAASDDTVFFADYDGFVYAVDGADGSEVWRSSVDDELGPPPAVQDGTVFVVSETGNAYAFDAEDGTELWSATTDEEEFAGQPAVIDDVVIARSAEHVVAFDVQDGATAWTGAAEATFSTSASMTAADGTVYVPFTDGLVAFDGTDGSERWRTDRTLSLTAPAVLDGTVYAAGDGNQVVALDADSGDRGWRVRLTGNARTDVVALDGSLFVGCDNSNRATADERSQALYALDPSDGATQWSIDAGGSIRGAPVVGDGTVCVGTEGEALYGIDADSGEQQWRFVVDDNVASARRFDSAAAIADGTLYAHSRSRQLFAIDVETGEEELLVEVDRELARFTDAPVLTGDRIYTTNYLTVGAFTRDTGARQWTYELDEEISGTPAVADGSLFVAHQDGDLFAVDVENGEQLWSVETGESCFYAPTVAEGTVLFLTTDALYGIDAENGSEQWSYPIEDGTLSEPAVADGTVYLPNGNELRAIDLTDGTENFVAQMDHYVDSPLTIADDTIYAGANDAVIAIDAESGEVLWNVDVGDTVDAAPAVVDGAVYAGSYDASVYAVTGDGSGGGSGGSGGSGDGDDGGSSSAVPGPGILGALTSLAGASYVLKRRLGRED